MPRILSVIKNTFVPSGTSPHRIRGGLLQGLSMNIDFSSQLQLYLGLNEKELEHWFRSLAKGIETTIDVGADQGIYTLFFLARTQTKKHFAFGPTLNSDHPLIGNLQLNGYSNDPRLHVEPKFVSSHNSSNECTLDSLMTQITPPCLVKIDVEGGEANVLEGSKNLLCLGGSRWIVETHSQSLEKECLKVFAACGYQTYIVTRAWWRTLVPELRPAEHNRWLVAYRSMDADLT